MAASFPTSVKSFTTKVDGAEGDLVAAADVNGLQDEVVAIETELKKTTGSVVDHGGLAGLADNDHPQYSLTTHNHDADYLGITAKAADSDKLNGEPGSYYLAATAKAADSDKLNGQSASYYQPVSTLGVWQAWVPAGHNLGFTTFEHSEFRYSVTGKTVFFTVDIAEITNADFYFALPTGLQARVRTNGWYESVLICKEVDTYIGYSQWNISAGNPYSMRIVRGSGAWSSGTLKVISFHGFYEAA